MKYIFRHLKGSLALEIDISTWLYFVILTMSMIEIEGSQPQVVFTIGGIAIN